MAKNKELLKKKKVSAFTMRSVVDDIARLYGKRLALRVYESASYDISFVSLKRKVDSLSLYLIENGVEKGDKIAILSENHPYWLVAYFAITSIGAVAVPILPEFSQKDVTDILSHSEAKGVVVNYRNFKKCLPFLEDDNKLLFRMSDLFCLPSSVVKDLNTDEDFLKAPGVDTIHREISYPLKKGKKNKKKKEYLPLTKELEARAPSEDDIASLIYTSGTTGKPKGVMLTHKNLVWNADISTDVYVNLKKGERVLSILPLSHVYEFTTSQILTLLCGCEINYLLKPPAPTILMKALRDVRPHVLNTVPVFIEKIYRSSIRPKLVGNKKLRFWLKRKLTRKMILRLIGKKLRDTMGGKLKFFGIGGAPLDKEVESFLYDANFPYAIGYGLTETSPLIAGSGPKTHKKGCIGKIVEHESVRLGDKDPVTGVGEIEVKGPNVMKGYYKDEELTASSFTEDGYFKTGDLGCFDKKGRLILKGRIKTMILGSGGENIYPESIEAKLNNQSFVEESLVVPENGGLVALIKLNLEGFSANLSKDIKDIKNEALKYIKSLKDSVNKDLMSSSKIDAVELQEEPFKRTPTLKIKRFLYSRTKNKHDNP